MKVFQNCSSPFPPPLTTVNTNLFSNLLSVRFYFKHSEATDAICALMGLTVEWGRDMKLSHNCKNSTVFYIKKERYEGIKLGKGTLRRRSGEALLKES